MTAIDLLVDAAVAIVQERLDADVDIVTATPLPRGADPFVGGDRPMLVVGTRWAAIPPGGVLIGGSPAAVAALLGFELPPRDGGGGAPGDAPGGEVESEAGGKESGSEDASSDGEEAPVAEAAPAAAPAMSWSSQVCAAARTHVAPVSVAIAHQLAERAGLPVDCAPIRVGLTEVPRTEVGPISDGLVLVLSRGEYEIRLVVVAPAVLLAHLQVQSPQGEPAAPINGPVPRAGRSGGPEGEVEPAQAIVHTLTEVPLDISLRVGRVHRPLHTVLALRPGDLLVLDQAADDPVELVAGTTRVASGEIETTEDGMLQFKVTGLAAERRPAVPPRTPMADVEPGGEPGSEPLVAIDGGSPDVGAAESAASDAADGDDDDGDDGDNGDNAA